MKIANSVSELIGNTPILALNNLCKDLGSMIYGKCEFLNPTSSVKDRVALNMIKDALNSGKINLDSTIIEPTSGNTGVALASICASLGIKLILTMPESMSLERRALLKAFGAKLELTDAKLGMKGAIIKAEELNKEIPNSIILQQFENIANPKAHESSTAKEILESTNGEIDYFVSAVGTGGTLSGVGLILKQNIPNIKVIAVEPLSSPVLSGGVAGVHKIQGIGAGFIPKVLNQSIYDEVITVSNEDAFNFAREVAKSDGVLVGISAGANLCASFEVAKRAKGLKIVTILCDTGERYLSSGLYE